MRRARYLAPWRREELPAELDLELKDSADALAALEGAPAIYHCVSRVVNKDKVFGPKEKEQFVKLMRLYERFCRVHVLAFAVMSNHFHILVEIPERPHLASTFPSDEKFLDHLSLLYSGEDLGEIRWQLEHLRSIDAHDEAEELRQRFFDRMYDLSSFMKSLKQRFTQWFNRSHERKGTLWEERFRSTLVQGGRAARIVAAYIDLNPVRAGLIWDPKDYRWCSYAQAVAGRKDARAGFQRVLFERALASGDESTSAQKVSSWRQIHRVYRELLFLDGQEFDGDFGTRRQGVRTFSRPQVARVLAAGGRLSEAQALRCRVRYFSDGLILGSRAFVEASFALSRAHFPSTRKSKACGIRHIDTELCTIRALQIDAVS